MVTFARGRGIVLFLLCVATRLMLACEDADKTTKALASDFHASFTASAQRTDVQHNTAVDFNTRPGIHDAIRGVLSFLVPETGLTATQRLARAVRSPEGALEMVDLVTQVWLLEGNKNGLLPHSSYGALRCALHTEIPRYVATPEAEGPPKTFRAGVFDAIMAPLRAASPLPAKPGPAVLIPDDLLRSDLVARLQSVHPHLADYFLYVHRGELEKNPDLRRAILDAKPPLQVSNETRDRLMRELDQTVAKLPTEVVQTPVPPPVMEVVQSPAPLVEAVSSSEVFALRHTVEPLPSPVLSEPPKPTVTRVELGTERLVPAPEVVPPEQYAVAIKGTTALPDEFVDALVKKIHAHDKPQAQWLRRDGIIAMAILQRTEAQYHPDLLKIAEKQGARGMLAWDYARYHQLYPLKLIASYAQATESGLGQRGRHGIMSSTAGYRMTEWLMQGETFEYVYELGRMVNEADLCEGANWELTKIKELGFNDADSVKSMSGTIMARNKDDAELRPYEVLGFLVGKLGYKAEQVKDVVGRHVKTSSMLTLRFVVSGGCCGSRYEGDAIRFLIEAPDVRYTADPVYLRKIAREDRESTVLYYLLLRHAGVDHDLADSWRWDLMKLRQTAGGNFTEELAPEFVRLINAITNSKLVGKPVEEARVYLVQGLAEFHVYRGEHKRAPLKKFLDEVFYPSVRKDWNRDFPEF